MGKRGPAPRGQVSTIWSSNLAYAVGLITTDGSLSINGRHINLTSKDREQVVNFKKCLGLKHIKIGRKSSGYSKKKLYYQVQFGDVLFYKWLMDLGLKPNKSKTLGSLTIPDQYFFDFLRGCFDGDGSINAYWDPRWHSSFMFYLNFVSASPQFLLWLQSTIIRLASAKGTINHSEAIRTSHLRYAKSATKILFNRMYYNKNIPYLKRKLVKAQKIFKIDKKHNAQVAESVDVSA